MSIIEGKEFFNKWDFHQNEDWEEHTRLTNLESENAAKTANAKLSEYYLIKKKDYDEARTIYCDINQSHWTDTLQTTKGKIAVMGDFRESVYSGKVICLEEIKKLCVEHEPQEAVTSIGKLVGYVCKHCGVKLKAVWHEQK